MPEFARMWVPLSPGEEKPSSLTDESPEGYRDETDAELRSRIVAKLKGLGIGTCPGDETCDNAAHDHKN